MTNLENLVLQLRWSQIGTLPDLAQLKNLHSLELYVDGWWLTEELPDLSRIPHLIKVKLVLEDSHVKDLSSLQRMVALEELDLYLQGTSLESIPDLEGLNKLNYVALDIRRSRIKLDQMGRLPAAQEITIDKSFLSLEGLPQSVKKLHIGP
jgi:hypothetical protein